MRTLFRTELPNFSFDLVTCGERGLVFRESATPALQKGGSQRSAVKSLVPLYSYILCRRTKRTKYDVVTHLGKRFVFRVQPRSRPRGKGLSDS